MIVHGVELHAFVVEFYLRVTNEHSDGARSAMYDMA